MPNGDDNKVPSYEQFKAIQNKPSQPTNKVPSHEEFTALKKKDSQKSAYGLPLEDGGYLGKSAQPTKSVSPSKSPSTSLSQNVIDNVFNAGIKQPKPQPTIDDLDSIEKKNLNADTPIPYNPASNQQAISKIIEQRQSPVHRTINANTFLVDDMHNNPDAIKGINPEDVINGGDKTNAATYVNKRISELKEVKQHLAETMYVPHNSISAASIKHIDDANKKINEIDNYIAEMTKFGNVANSNQAAANTPLPKDANTATLAKDYFLHIGVKSGAINDPIGTEHKESNIKDGIDAKRNPEIVELENYRKTSDGLDSREDFIDAQHGMGKMSDYQYNSEKGQIKQVRDKLFDVYPKAKEVAINQALGQVLQENRAKKYNTEDDETHAFTSAFHSLVYTGYSDEEIKSAGQQLKLSDDEIKKSINNKDDIHGTSISGTFWNSFINHTSEDILSIGRTAEQNESDKYQSDKSFQLAPNQQLETPDVIKDVNPTVKDATGKDINNPNFLKDVANPNAGNHNWGVGDLNTVSNAVGSLAGLWLTTEATAGLGDAALGGRIGTEVVGVKNTFKGLEEVKQLSQEQRAIFGNVVGMTMTQFAQNKEIAKEFIGKEQGGDNAQNIYAITRGIETGLLFGLGFAPQKLIGKALGLEEQAAAKQFADLIPKKGIEYLDKTKWTEYLKNNLVNGVVGKGVAANLEATTMMAIDQAAQVGTQAMFNPQSVQSKNVGNDIMNEGIKNFLTFAPISFLGASVGVLSNPHDSQAKLEQEAIYRMGKDPITYKNYVDGQVKDFKVSQDDANKRIHLVNEMSSIHNSGVVNENLSRSEKIEYANNTLHEKILQNQIDKIKKAAPTDPSIGIKERQIESLQKRRSEILNNSDGVDKDGNGKPLTPTYKIGDKPVTKEIFLHALKQGDAKDILSNAEVSGDEKTQSKLRELGGNISESDYKTSTGIKDETQPEKTELSFVGKQDDVLVKDRTFFNENEEKEYHDLISDGKKDDADLMIEQRKKELIEADKNDISSPKTEQNEKAKEARKGQNVNQKGADAVNVSVPSSEGKAIVEPKKAISTMNSDELYEYAKETKKALRKQDIEFENKTEEEKDKAGYNDIIDNVSDLRDASELVGFIESAENGDDIASTLKNVIIGMDKENPSEYDLAVLNAAKKKAVELGIEPNSLIKTVLDKVGSQYKDIDDAKTMMKDVFDKIKTSSQDKIGKASSIEEEKPVTSKEETGYTGNGLDRAKAKQVYREAGKIDEPTDARSAALKYIADGGKIHPDDINDISGTVDKASLNTGAKEKKSTEVKDRDYVDKNAPSIKEVAHKIWDGLSESLQNKISDSDIRNELEDVISTHNKRLDAANEYVDKYSIENNLSKKEQDFYEQHYPKEQGSLEKWLEDESDKTYESEEHLPNEDYINQIINDYDKGNETENQQPSEGAKTKSDSGVGETSNPVEDKGRKEESELTPPEPPKTNEPLNLEGMQPQQQWTAIRKEKQKEIESVKESYEKQGTKKWTETLNNALNNLQTSHPDKTLYDAASIEMEFIKNKVPSSIPKDEQLASMQYLKRETETKRNALYDDTMSDDELKRTAALFQDKLLFDKLNDTALAIKGITTESGRTLNYAQSELGYDEEHGLQLRRMDLIAAKGDKLNDKELALTAEQWEKEKELNQKIQEAKEKGMQEKFDKQIEELKSEYDKKLKDASTKKDKPKEENRKKLLSQSGKEFADKLRSGKLKGGTYSTIPGFPQAVNLTIEAIAQIVEKGSTLAEAIAKYIDDNKIKGKDDFTDNFMRVLENRQTREDSFDKLKEEAALSKVNGITSEMVGKNIIKNFINSHIGEVDTKDILNVATEQLKEIFPDLTKEKLTEAYLKQGEFKQETKRQLENYQKSSESKLVKLSKIEKDITDLKTKKNLFTEKTPDSKIRETDRDISSKEKELKSLMTEAGVKTSNEDKFTKASYESRTKSHNDRLDSISDNIKNKIDKGGLNEEQKSLLNKLNNQLDSAKVKLDTNSKISNAPVLDNGLTVLKKVKSEFDRNIKLKDVAALSEFKRDLQKAIDAFGTDKDKSEQDIKLQRTKGKYERDIEEFKRKINAGEFEDKPIVTLTKSDAELIRLEKEKLNISQQYYQKKDEYERANKSGVKRTFEFARAAYVDWLIGSPITLAKVAFSAIVRPNVEALTKKVGGSIFDKVFPELSQRAKLGGESNRVAAGYEAYARQYSPEQLEKKYTEANDKYEKSSKAYNEFKGQVELMDKRTSDYKDAEKKLQKLDNIQKTDLVNAVGNSVYQFIAGSSIKEGLQVLQHRTATIESMFGEFDNESWQKLKDSPNKFATVLDNINYTMNYIGRSHAALKTFSGRFSFAAGFISRLEGAVNDGVDITQPNKILEIANESYLDWDRGKYQQSNVISDGWNKIVQAVDKVSTIASYIMKSDVAVTRVPVNILHEAVMEYSLGAITSAYNIGKEYYKATKKIDLKVSLTKEDREDFRKQLKEEVSKLDPEKAAAIARSFRKGGFGLGMYALAALGVIQFGGFGHRGQTNDDKKTKKIEDETGEHQLKTGEIEIGGKPVNENVAKIMEHASQLYPLFLAQGLKTVYDNNIKQGKSSSVAATKDALQHINIILGNIPQIGKVLLPMASDVYQSVVPKVGSWDDVDQDGNPIKRKAFEMRDYLNIIPGYGDKKEVLSDVYFKQAVKTKKYYEAQKSQIQLDANLSNEDKEEQIKNLNEQEDKDINDIYTYNKNNPQ